MFPLTQPVEFDGVLVKELQRHDISLMDIRDAGQYRSLEKKTFHYVCRLVALSPDQVRELDAEDYLMLADACSDFLD